jgi:hypothetical protein
MGIDSVGIKGKVVAKEKARGFWIVAFLIHTRDLIRGFRALPKEGDRSRDYELLDFHL